MGISGADELPHLVVREDHVARLCRVRQTDQTDFPCLTVLNPLVVMYSVSCDLGEQAVTPFFSAHAH